MVGSSITLDPEQILAGPRGMNNSKVDPEAGHPNLWMDVVSGLPYWPGHGLFKWALELTTVQGTRPELSRFGEVKEAGTSSIWIAANLSSTALGVRPGASGLSRARSVTCRQ
jgi:hypothetical protein